MACKIFAFQPSGKVLTAWKGKMDPCVRLREQMRVWVHLFQIFPFLQPEQTLVHFVVRSMFAFEKKYISWEPFANFLKKKKTIKPTLHFRTASHCQIYFRDGQLDKNLMLTVQQYSRSVPVSEKAAKMQKSLSLRFRFSQEDFSSFAPPPLL